MLRSYFAISCFAFTRQCLFFIRLTAITIWFFFLQNSNHETFIESLAGKISLFYYVVISVTFDRLGGQTRVRSDNMMITYLGFNFCNWQINNHDPRLHMSIFCSWKIPRNMARKWWLNPLQILIKRKCEECRTIPQSWLSDLGSISAQK